MINSQVMNSVPAIPRQSELAVCREVIDALVADHAEIKGALVSTVDGFPVAACLGGALSEAKLSAMTSALLALAAAMSGESDVGECRDLMIDASAGKVLLMDVPDATRQWVLTVLCKDKATLGQVLWTSRQCREEIISRLGASA